MVWTEELSRYIFIWITYLALCVAIKRRSSIRVDIIYDKLPKRWQDLSWIVVHICFLVLTVMIAVTGWSQIERLLTFPQYTPAMRIPFLIPYLILPIGFGLMSIRLIQDICRQIKICGTKDSLIALGIVFLVGLPLYPVLIVGTFMEALAAIVILTPILLPIVTGVGVSPLHFGIIIVVNLAIGFITPPVGVNLFVSSGISGCKLANLSKSVLPMIGLMLLVLLVITYFPQVPLCLVSGH